MKDALVVFFWWFLLCAMTLVGAVVLLWSIAVALTAIFW